MTFSPIFRKNVLMCGKKYPGNTTLSDYEGFIEMRRSCQFCFKCMDGDEKVYQFKANSPAYRTAGKDGPG
jgi:uncharacterized membrane protein (UPF0182 family)